MCEQFLTEKPMTTTIRCDSLYMSLFHRLAARFAVETIRGNLFWE
jgi:hypothetical protein